MDMTDNPRSLRSIKIHLAVDYFNGHALVAKGFYESYVGRGGGLGGKEAVRIDP